MKLKKMFALLVSVVLLFSALAVPASAIDVSLTKQQEWVSSDPQRNVKQVKGRGSNSSDSAHRVYFQFFYRPAYSSQNWSEDAKKYVRPGFWFPDANSSDSDCRTHLISFKFNTNMDWIMQLNPTGIYKNCSATATFWNIA